MGVLRRHSRLLMTGHISLDDYLPDDESGDELRIENDATETTTRNGMSHRRRQRDGRSARRAQWLNDMTSDLNMTKKERMGARKQRRYENARFLYSSVNAEDICEDYSDILQSTVTALSKLFIEEGNMQAWTIFTEKNEEEQREFLRSCETEETHQHCSCCCGNSEGVDIFEHRPCDTEASFSRLNRRFRVILRNKTLPLEFMTLNEEEMRKFFHNNALPLSEWSSSVLPRLQRLIIHALSQYLSLISKSVVIGAGDEKFVKVRNKYCSFRPPSETLVDYLKRIRGTGNAENTVS